MRPGPERLLEVFGEQRRRLVAILRGFGPDDWAAPTRYADWSAYDVVRHLQDRNAIAAGAGPDDFTLDITADFDPRISPREQLSASAGESPEATLRRFVATTEQVLAVLRARLTRNRRFDVRLPYRPMDWTAFVLHGSRDPWLHERELFLARGTGHPTDDDAAIYVAAHGVFIAAAVASMSGDPVQEKMRLASDGGGIFDLGSHNAVTLTVTRVTTAGPRSHHRHATTGVHNRVSTTLIVMRADRPHMHTAADQFRAGARHTDRRHGALRRWRRRITDRDGLGRMQSGGSPIRAHSPFRTDDRWR